ncbi:MAG: AAA family ATPase [Gemmatimonadales bacterium]|jgi:chloramphenicol 3-O-phosphotransferase
MHPAPILLITGVMAAGKSTVAQSIAEQLNPSVHLRGDVFRRMVTSGRVEMSAEPTPEALRQLHLRYEAASQVAKLYSDAGFTVVYQDTIIGEVLGQVVELYRGHPLHVIVLCPRAEVVAQRELGRDKTGYSHFTVEALQEVMRSTPRIGTWIDNSDQSVPETCRAIRQRLEEARNAWH